MTNVQNLPEILHNALDAKPTRSQVALLRAMSSEVGMLMTHAQLLGVLDRRGDGMDRVTLYRTLEKLVCAGVLVSMIDDSRVTRYALAESNTKVEKTASGARFECQRCHQQYLVSTSQSAISEALNSAASLTKSAGHRPLEIEVSIRGICSKCITD